MGKHRGLREIQNMSAAVFIDRDGVLNESLVLEGRPHAPRQVDEFKLLPGSGHAIQALRRAGFVVIVVTNQPDVAKGLVKRSEVEQMHRLLRRQIPVDDIKVCYHVDEDGCECRKPKPGMLLQAAQEWSVSLADSYMIGDRWRDIEAGQAAGCKTIFVENHYQEKRPSNPDRTVQSLLEASELILGTRL